VNFKKLLPSLDLSVTLCRVSRLAWANVVVNDSDVIASTAAAQLTQRKGPSTKRHAWLATASPKINLAVRVENQGRYGVRL
jgi:hypothetical protein